MKYLLLAIIIIIGCWCYSMGIKVVLGILPLKTDFSATDVSPKFKINTISIVTQVVR